MTDFNKYNPYPHIATIRCPRCEGPAEFRRGIALVSHKSWEWWVERLWPCARATDWEGKERWQPGDPPPSWRGWIIIEHDPDIIRWKQPTRGYSATDAGMVTCGCSVGRHPHVLRWPSEAYYRFELPQGVLWAWSRAGAQAAIDFIASDVRDPSAHGGHYLFLRHIPQTFLRAKGRDAVVKRLQRDLKRL